MARKAKPRRTPYQPPLPPKPKSVRGRASVGRGRAAAGKPRRRR